MTERTFHAAFDLLDRQILDREGTPVGKVDDLLLEPAPRGGLRVAALLVGPQAYGPRVGGRLGRWIVDIAARLGGERDPVRIPVSDIERIAANVELRVLAEDLERVGRVERWLAEHVVGRLPGSTDAAE